MTIIILGAVALALYFLQIRIFRLYWDRNLTASIMFENNTMQEGDKGWLREVIENRKRLPLPMLKVKFRCSRELRF